MLRCERLVSRNDHVVSLKLAPGYRQLHLGGLTLGTSRAVVRRYFELSWSSLGSNFSGPLLHHSQRGDDSG